MFFVPDSFLEEILADDIPYGDLTTMLLGIEDCGGVVHAYPKADTVVCGVELAARLFAKVGLDCKVFCREGESVPAGRIVLTAKGSAGAIHAVYKSAQTIMEFASGIATRVHSVVEEAKAGNPRCRVTLTRKHFPGTKVLSLYAAAAGGALPHRTGLSESVLVFDQHRVFVPEFTKKIKDLKTRDPERKIAVEANSPEEGMLFARAGADIIQCEKFPTETLRAFVAEVKNEVPGILVSTAGGINADNARAYAAAGVDFLVTSWPYFGKPCDIKMQILAQGDS